MSWIKTIAVDQATGPLADLYRQTADASGRVDNVLLVHSLRPHSMRGHLALYTSVLHHTGNKLPRWLLELVGAWVSQLNGCEYCREHHLAGMQRELGDARRGEKIQCCITEGMLQEAGLSGRERAALVYAEALTRQPAQVSVRLIESLKAAGYSDGEILEINQVAAYFNYVNRVVLGLGVTLESDSLGHSPVAES